MTELTAQQRAWTGPDGGREGAPSLQLKYNCALELRTHARTRMHDERRDVRSAGVARWLDHCMMGEHGAYAHRLGGPLSLRALSPRPHKAAAPKGPAFCFLNY